MRRDIVALKVTLANTYKPVLDFVKEVTNIGAVSKLERVIIRHKTAYLWQANSMAAYTFIKEILPYLIVKREQALLAMETFERLRDPIHKADRSWHLEYYKRMKALNRRGPAPALPVEAAD
jgi:hypothetical protein